jgi:hypothetical protein
LWVNRVTPPPSMEDSITKLLVIFQTFPYYIHYVALLCFILTSSSYRGLL